MEHLLTAVLSIVVIVLILIMRFINKENRKEKEAFKAQVLEFEDEISLTQKAYRILKDEYDKFKKSMEQTYSEALKQLREAQNKITALNTEAEKTQARTNKLVMAYDDQVAEITNEKNDFEFKFHVLEADFKSLSQSHIEKQRLLRNAQDRFSRNERKYVDRLDLLMIERRKNNDLTKKLADCEKISEERATQVKMLELKIKRMPPRKKEK